ncbi:alpha-2-macroglobulin, partial [Parapusillimonas sp. SGNA-6]|nr:alpha-2-macroglobulin [Parapusillimonas sp. SGNA-6]
YDANRQKIDSLQLTTNAFGSANGTFKLPNRTLAGTFRLEVKAKEGGSDTHYLRVEEYKRPTFKVEFEPNKETYTLKDTAVFVGKAESLAGAKLPDATVRYTVKFYGGKQYKYRTINYLDTVTITDADGRFKIVVPLMDTIFRGLTDFSLSYTAEVSTPSGEMQSASGSYAFSTKPWRIAVQSAYSVEEKRWSTLHIRTTNQNGQPLKFAGKVNIYKIGEHRKPLSDVYEQYFQNTEYHLLDNDEYERYFPHYFDALTLKKGTKEYMQSYTFDTRDTSLVALDSNLFTKGRYSIEAFTVQGNDTVRASATTYVYDAKTRKTNENQFFSYALDKDSYTIGDKVTIRFYTDVAGADNLFLFPSIGNIKEDTQVLTWRDGQASYSFVLREDMISPTVEFSALFVRNNQAAQVS